MSGLFSTTPSVAIPAFLGGPTSAPAPSAATLQNMNANPGTVQTMGVETWSSAQTVELLSLQRELGRIQQELNRLLASLTTAAPAPQTGVIHDAWQYFSDLFTNEPSKPSKPTKPTPPPQPTKNGPTEFVLSSFNVLSSAAGKGKGYAPGIARIHSVAQILKTNNVSVVGFQEMDSNQLAEFKKVAGDQYGTVAGASGKRGYHDTTIAWRKDTWNLVKSGSITVPSYAGRDSKVPFVRLRNKHTGQEAYFIDAHNPANTRRYHHQERFRDKAARMEADLAKRLIESTGLPVFIVGDMNSVREARDIFTQGAPVKAANPRGKAGIDWIFGSKNVQFSNFRRTRDGLIGKTTDHPVVFSNVRIGGK